MAAAVRAAAGRGDWHAADGGRKGRGDPAAARRGGAHAGTGDRPKKIVGHPLRNARERYAQVEAMKGDHPVRLLCEVLAVSRSGYYRWQERSPTQRQRDDARLAA